MEYIMIDYHKAINNYDVKNMYLMEMRSYSLYIVKWKHQIIKQYFIIKENTKKKTWENSKNF